MFRRGMKSKPKGGISIAWTIDRRLFAGRSWRDCKKGSEREREGCIHLWGSIVVCTSCARYVEGVRDRLMWPRHRSNKASHNGRTPGTLDGWIAGLVMFRGEGVGGPRRHRRKGGLTALDILPATRGYHQWDSMRDHVRPPRYTRKSVVRFRVLSRVSIPPCSHVSSYTLVIVVVQSFYSFVLLFLGIGEGIRIVELVTLHFFREEILLLLLLCLEIFDWSMGLEIWKILLVGRYLVTFLFEIQAQTRASLFSDIVSSNWTIMSGNRILKSIDFHVSFVRVSRFRVDRFWCCLTFHTLLQFFQENLSSKRKFWKSYSISKYNRMFLAFLSSFCFRETRHQFIISY